VFVNLLVNAAHAIPDGHAGENEVTVEARPLADGRVAVEVRDTGVGVAPEILPRLFEPFFTTKPRAFGTGLGLAICHGIVQAHGGVIEVESAPGQGACFRVILPGSAPGEAEAAAPAPAVPAPRRARVLVVDDEPQVCEAVTRLLGREHQVEAVTQSRAALELIRSGARFDAVLCDVMMPDMTGVQLHDAVVALAPAQAARFAFMTGGVFSGETQRLLRQARRPVLEKPFDREALSTCVRQLTAAATASPR
jgi:CheY-like chemotaxis protein